MSTSAMAVELLEQLLARDKELDSRECAIIVWEDGLAALEHALGRACMERDAERTQAEAAQHRTTLLERVPLPPSPSTPLTSTEFWRNARSSLPLQKTDLEV
jgi:hypothetical protein